MRLPSMMEKYNMTVERLYSVKINKSQCPRRVPAENETFPKSNRKHIIMAILILTTCANAVFKIVLCIYIVV